MMIAPILDDLKTLMEDYKKYHFRQSDGGDYLYDSIGRILSKYTATKTAPEHHCGNCRWYEDVDAEYSYCTNPWYNEIMTMRTMSCKRWQERTNK